MMFLVTIAFGLVFGLIIVAYVTIIGAP